MSATDPALALPAAPHFALLRYIRSTTPESSVASSFTGNLFTLCKVPSLTPEMDNFIFEDPSKQRQRPKRPLQVLPIGIIRKQQDPNDAEQQKGVPSQGLDACNSDFAGSGLPFEKSTTDGDGDKGCQVHSSPESCESDPAHIPRASVLELFSMSGEDHYSADEGSPSQRDSLFSSPEPEGSAIDSDSGVSFATHKRGDDPTSSHLLSYDRIGTSR